ncbi:MAG: hypothetical protein AAB583_02815 [Patescibacteria group bacterium]
METVGEKDSVEGGSNSLTLEKAHYLAFWVFAMSQGDNALKRSVLEFVHFYHPDWKIGHDFKKELVAELNSSAPKYMQNSRRHIPLNSSRAQYTVPHLVELMAGIFNSEVTAYDINKLFIGTIEGDYRWIYEKGGRSGRDRLTGDVYDDVSPMADPFISFFCHYGIEGADTKVPEYNQMFQEVERFGRDYSSGKIRLESIDRGNETPFRTKFEVVLLEYAKTHPRRSASWPSEWLSRK